jgi:two-component system, chemotaxis family, chemotaxis protein CheY
VEEQLITLRALVIDDSRVMRGMVMESLKKTELAEFEFTQAGSGREALEVFKPEETDIIFCDWNMPEMNGIEFARQVRSMSWASHIPVVMVTSESGDGRQQDAFNEARITCYITKPFTVEEIIEKLTPVLAEMKRKQEKAAAPAKPAAAPAKAAGGFFSKLIGG